MGKLWYIKESFKMEDMNPGPKYTGLGRLSIVEAQNHRNQSPINTFLMVYDNEKQYNLALNHYQNPTITGPAFVYGDSIA